MRVGPWELLGPLGQGATAEVWDAIHVEHRTTAAVKVLTAAHARSERNVRAFEREVRAVAGLNHPGVVLLHDVGVASVEGLPAGAPWVAMERAHGSLRNQGRPGVWDDLLPRLLALLDALGHAHGAGVIHRDLKPGNVLVGDDGRWLLADFGLAHTVDELGHGVGGTPAFMAPEQFRADWRRFGPWTDLYAVGGLVWALVSGRPPYSGRSVADLHAAHAAGILPTLRPRFEVPGGLLAWLQRLLHPDPRQRFQRCADAAHAVASLSGGWLPPRDDDTSEEPSTRTLTRSLDVAATEAPPARVGPARAPRRMPPWPRSPPAEPPARSAASLGLYGLREAPLVGRERELDALWTLLGDARAARQFRIVVLAGDAGVGKSRLARTFATRAHAAGGAERVRVLPHPDGGELSDLAAQLTRSHGLTGGSLETHLDRWLADRSVTDELVRKGLLDLLSASGNARPAERYAVLRAALRAVTAGQVDDDTRPLLMWVDDAPHAPDAVRFVAALAERPGLPGLAVLTARCEPTPSGAWEALEALPATWIDVGPLGAEARQALVRQLLVLDGAVADQVVARTDGNPLFAVQLVGDWVQRGILEPSPRGFVLRRDAAVDLPDDIHALWNRRIDRFVDDLGAATATRDALALAALLGAEVDPNEWSAACRVAGVSVERALVNRLFDQQLAEPRGERWAFAHGMLRESLLRATRDSARWIRLNDACATALWIRADVARGPGLAERLGRHLVDAGRDAEAVEWLVLGSRERVDRSDYAAALELFDRTTAALDRCRRPLADPLRGRIAVGRAQVLSALGRHDDAHDLAAATATAFAAVPSVRTLALRIAGLADAKRGALDRAEARLVDAIAAADDAASLADRASAEAYLAEVHRLRGRPGDARWWGERALSAFDALGSVRGSAEAHVGLAAAAATLDDIAEAERHVALAERCYQALGARFGIATTTLARGDLCRKSGDLDAAAAAYLRAGEILTDLGAADRLYASYNLALTRLAQQRWTDASAALVDAEAVATSSGRRGFLGAIFAAKLPLLAHDGDEAGFGDALAQAEDRLGRSGIVEPDVAWTFELGAAAARALGWRALAERATKLAATQRPTESR